MSQPRNQRLEPGLRPGVTQELRDVVLMDVDLAPDTGVAQPSLVDPSVDRPDVFAEHLGDILAPVVTGEQFVCLHLFPRAAWYCGGPCQKRTPWAIVCITRQK